MTTTYTEDEAFWVMETIYRGENCPACNAAWHYTSPTSIEMNHTEDCTWILFFDALPDED